MAAEKQMVLFEAVDDSSYVVLEEKAISAQTFRFLGDYTLNGEFMDGHDTMEGMRNSCEVI